MGSSKERNKKQLAAKKRRQTGGVMSRLEKIAYLQADFEQAQINLGLQEADRDRAGS